MKMVVLGFPVVFVFLVWAPDIFRVVLEKLSTVFIVPMVAGTHVLTVTLEH